MTSYVNDMWPGSPQRKDSPAGAGTGRSSRLSSRSRSSSSSASSRAVSPRSERSSGSRSRSRSRRRRSRSRSRRRHQRKYRRYSRSYSRSRSRSRGRRYRERLPPRGSRRHRRSPSRSRSRSRGRSRSHRPALGPRGRRYYGFGRTLYPESRPGWRWRSRSRSRSRSHTPLCLSDKDRMELLEIAKANAAKALGTANIDLPASLKTGLLSKDANYGKQIQSDATKLELSGRFNEDVIKTSSESSSLQRNLPFSSGNSVANPVLQKTTKETARFPNDEKSQSSYGQWIPVKKEENSLLLSSPKTTLSFKF